MKTHWVALGLIVVLLLVGGSFGFGLQIASHRAEKRIQSALMQADITAEKLSVSRNKERNLTKVLSKAQSEDTRLREVIASLKARPADVRYIVRTETVLKPSEPKTVVVTELPPSHKFTLQDKLVVAEFETEGEEYRFLTHKLELRARMAISEDKTAISVEASTSADPEHWEEVEVSLEVDKISKVKPVEFNIGAGFTLGGGGNIATSLPTPGVYGGLTLTFLHPKSDLDVLQFRIGTDGQSLAGGIDPVSINIGEHLPVLTDFWVAPIGATIATNGALTFGTTVSSKF